MHMSLVVMFYWSRFRCNISIPLRFSNRNGIAMFYRTRMLCDCDYRNGIAMNKRYASRHWRWKRWNVLITASIRGLACSISFPTRLFLVSVHRGIADRLIHTAKKYFFSWFFDRSKVWLFFWSFVIFLLIEACNYWFFCNYF